MRFRDAELGGWGNYPTAKCRVARPEKSREAQWVVQSPEVPHVLARGLGRSYGDAALNEGGGVLLHERLNRFVAFDAATGELEAEAGASFEDILRVFVPRGFFPPVTPGTKFVTLGGAVAADVHGKNHHRDGLIAEFVSAMWVMDADGRVTECSRAREPDLFWATIGGMGLTGVILRLRLALRRIETPLLRVRYQRSRHLDETLERFEQGDRDYQYSVCWIDCLASGTSLGRSVLMRGNHLPAAEAPRGCALTPEAGGMRGKRLTVPFRAPSMALNPFSVGLFNSAYYSLYPRDAERLVGFEPYFYPLDGIGHWNRLYGRAGFVQFQAVLPFGTSRRGLVSLLESLSRSRRPSFLAVLKTMGRASGAWLGFCLPGHTLTLDIPRPGRELEPLLDDLTATVRDCGGRIYLAKDATLRPEAFREMYPEADRFRELKARVDPRCRFQSSLARRVGLVQGT